MIDIPILERNGIGYEEICPNLDEIKQRITALAEYEEWLLDTLKKAEAVVLYGAGKIGKRMLRYLREQGDINIVGFAVSDEQDKDMYVDDMPVYHIGELIRYSKSAEIILTVGMKLQQEMETNLKKLGFEKILRLNPDFNRFVL